MTMRSQRRQSIPLEENETEQANKAIMASFYFASLNRCSYGRRRRQRSPECSLLDARNDAFASFAYAREKPEHNLFASIFYLAKCLRSPSPWRIYCKTS